MTPMPYFREGHSAPGLGQPARPSRFCLRQSGINLSRSGYRWFESIFLLRGVCKLSVPPGCR